MRDVQLQSNSDGADGSLRGFLHSARVCIDRWNDPSFHAHIRAIMDRDVRLTGGLLSLVARTPVPSEIVEQRIVAARMNYNAFSRARPNARFHMVYDGEFSDFYAGLQGRTIFNLGCLCRFARFMFISEARRALRELRGAMMRCELGRTGRGGIIVPRNVVWLADSLRAFRQGLLPEGSERTVVDVCDGLLRMAMPREAFDAALARLDALDFSDGRAFRYVHPGLVLLSALSLEEACGLSLRAVPIRLGDESLDSSGWLVGSHRISFEEAWCWVSAGIPVIVGFVVSEVFLEELKQGRLIFEGALGERIPANVAVEPNAPFWGEEGEWNMHAHAVGSPMHHLSLVTGVGLDGIGPGSFDNLELDMVGPGSRKLLVFEPGWEGTSFVGGDEGFFAWCEAIFYDCQWVASDGHVTGGSKVVEGPVDLVDGGHIVTLPLPHLWKALSLF